MILENDLYKLVEARHGYFLVNPNDRYIGAALIKYGEFSELEWTLIDQLLRAGQVVVEVGANIGAHSVSIARKIGPKGRLWAIEPQRIVFQNLCANVALNGLTNVRTINAAMSDEAGTIRVPPVDYRKSGNFGGISLMTAPAKGGEDVPMLRLDDAFTGRRLDLLKIDVEGMEARVLRGGAETVATFRPILYLENDRQDLAQELIELVFSMGYRAWWHAPRLFNPDNFFGERENDYDRTASLNMLCLPKDSKIVVKDLKEITDPAAIMPAKTDRRD